MKLNIVFFLTNLDVLEWLMRQVWNQLSFLHVGSNSVVDIFFWIFLAIGPFGTPWFLSTWIIEFNLMGHISTWVIEFNFMGHVHEWHMSCWVIRFNGPKGYGSWYERRDINHTIYLNEDVKKRLSKLSKDVFNSCYIEEEWSLIVVNFGWVTI